MPAGLKNLVTRVQRLALGGAVRRIELPARADLRQQLAVVAVLLEDAVVVAAHPEIVFAVNAQP
jgi:hypothetical protein